ncbi:MAG: hypothetical protein ACLFPV_15600 [Spirochaetaceae bacterium]
MRQQIPTNDASPADPAYDLRWPYEAVAVDMDQASQTSGAVLLE